MSKAKKKKIKITLLHDEFTTQYVLPEGIKNVIILNQKYKQLINHKVQ